ncbi:MAG: 50S ribosome-binding GTPase, partial [Lentisphaeria bacterium]|nr:50S ribosome-binding GTPase [Lentisphaeria bacterium]
MSKTTFRIALAGNPNCGKTCIFNALTGARQHVGNYPGVTVESKGGSFKLNGMDIELIDLPGVYSLSSSSPEEEVVFQELTKPGIDLIINVIDSTIPQRSMYLTTQLAELHIPMLLTFNMADDAKKKGLKYNIPKLYEDMYELFDDPEVDIVLNITRPYEHYEVTKQALLHGKHVYSEKPLSPDLKEAYELVALAKEKNLLLGGAPDTFMGSGIQTARHLIDSGFIGTPIGGSAHFISRGPEDWHPDPEAFYKYGGGPMFDMGPYYVTALINLLGGVDTV